MRAHLPSYELRAPSSLAEALRILAERPGEWRPFAGGTDLMVALEAGRLAHRRYLSLWRLPELRGITEEGGYLRIGALTTYTELRFHPRISSDLPMLAQAARETGAVAIQNRGTLGGNIANASPAADSPPALLAYDAEVELASDGGSRWVPYREFHTGYKATRMLPHELIRSVRVPLPGPGSRAVHYYRKVGTRKAQAISKVCFAGLAVRDDSGALADVRIALGSVAPVPLRCERVEATLRGRALDGEAIARAEAELAREIHPIDDLRSTREYRLRVATLLLREFLERL